MFTIQLLPGPPSSTDWLYHIHNINTQTNIFTTLYYINSESIQRHSHSFTVWSTLDVMTYGEVLWKSATHQQMNAIMTKSMFVSHYRDSISAHSTQQQLRQPISILWSLIDFIKIVQLVVMYILLHHYALQCLLCHILKSICQIQSHFWFLILIP